MKKIIFVFLLIFSLGLYSNNVNANFNEPKEVTSDKYSWTITLSESVSTKSVNLKTVYIINTENNKKIPVKYSYSSDKKKIFVEPAFRYVEGRGYILMVRDLKSSRGKKLKNKVEMPFVYNAPKMTE